MKKALFFCLLMLPAISMAQQTEEPANRAYIDAIGEAFREAEPDMIYVKVTLNERELSKSVSEHETRLLANLQDAGISIEERVTVSNLNSTLYQRWIGKDKDISVKELEILATSAEELELVFDALKSAEIYNARISRSLISNRLEIEQEVEIEAIKNAREKASNLASSINQEIGKALIISDRKSQPSAQSLSGQVNGVFSGSEVVITAYGVRGARGVNNVESFSLQIRKQRISASVFVRFELN